MTPGPHHVDGTVPYPWPWCGLDPARTALVVVSSPVHPGEDATTVAAMHGRIAAYAETLIGHGVVTLHARVRPPYGPRPPAPTIDLDLPDLPAALVLDATGWDAFHSTALDGYLRAGGRDHLLLAGWWTEIGVHSTMRAANDRGHECLLLTDLTVGLDPATTAGAISSVHMSGGIFGATGSVDAVLEALDEGN